MNDLKLLDELLVNVKQYTGKSFQDLDQPGSVERQALDRLQMVHDTMPAITLSLSDYLRERERHD